MNFNQFLNEASSSSYGGPAGLTKDETLKIAQKFADAAASVDPEKGKWAVNKRTLEEDSFDLDYNGEEFDGGSYNIYKNGNVVNMALRENPVLGKMGDDIKTIAKGFKKMMTNESFDLNEGMSFDEIKDKYENNPYGIGAQVVQYVHAHGSSKLIFKHDDKYRRDQIVDKLRELGVPAKKLSKSTADKVYKYRYELTMYESVEINESKVTLDTTEPDDKSLVDFCKKHGIKIKEVNPNGPGGDFAEYEYTGSTLNLKKMIDEFWEDDYLHSLIESVVNEGFENSAIQKALKDCGYDLKQSDFKLSKKKQSGAVFYYLNGEIIGNDDYGYDMLVKKATERIKENPKKYGLNESVVNERNITIKRQYTDKNPAVTVGKAAKVRNRMLEAIKDGKLSQEDFNNILKEMTTDSKRWLRRNAQCFNVSEDGITLSKTGSRILKNVMVSEATTKAPEIWVPGGFDKEIAKYPNQKITRKIVLDAAKKWDVNPEDAIKYVEFAWVIDLDENKNNNDMKAKFIYESFQEFVENKLNESKEAEEASNILDDLLGERDTEELHGMSIEDAMDTVKTYGHSGTKAKKIAEFLFGMCNESTLNEAFKSAKLANLFSVGSAGTKDLAGAFYNFSKLAIDKIEDYDIIEMDPQTARKEKRANGVYFYVVTNQKENPYIEGSTPSTYNNGIIQSNTLLAITNGSNEWYSTSYSSYSKTETLKVTKTREDASGFDKRDSKRYDGSGITSLTKVAELADVAYVIDLDVLKARYSTASLVSKRAADKSGATAFQNDKDFKAANKARYNEILAQKASELPMDSLVLGAIDTLATQIKDALSKGEKGRYGELIVGLDPKGREIKMSDASNLMRNILDEYNRYVGYAVESEKEVATGYSGKFYEGRLKESAKTITDYVKKVEAKNYAW